MKTIYERITEECPNNIIGNHESDLYVLINEQTARIIEEQKEQGEVLNVSTFTDNERKRACYDIAFAYDPFWNKLN